jgi:cyclophilin family peptidyl-prolyl cis-trans isomerase
MFHRIVPDFLVQTGDVLYQDGRGGRSVYAPYFIDEQFVHQHRAAGYVAMANTGVDTNNSQFYFTLAKARWLDKRNVVFGKVLAGMVRVYAHTLATYTGTTAHHCRAGDERERLPDTCHAVHL